jgi:aromatic-L-amino-acid decarboxylase
VPFRDPLELDPETMRRLGYRAVDLLVERAATLGEAPAWRGATRAEMEERLRERPPASPQDADEIFAQIARDVLPYAGHHDHPRFFAFVPSCPTWPGVLGDLLASGVNTFAGTWLQSAGVSTVELVVIDWFRQWLDWPPETSGILVSGGSQANFTALACARESVPGARSERAVVYLSSEGHSSVPRAVRIVGFADEQVHLVPTDDLHRIRPDALAAAIRADLGAGITPACIVATLGTTSTGAFDPLPPIADLAREHGAYLHVDAAWAGSALICPEQRAWAAGLEQADSLVLNPHKWLLTNFDCSAHLVRRPDELVRTLAINPAYLQTREGATVTDYRDWGIPLGRRFRALKLWFVIRAYGVEGLQALIRRHIALTRELAAWIEAEADFDLTSGPSLALLTFRYHPRGVNDDATLDTLNARLLEAVNDDGRTYLTQTRLRGRYVIRASIGQTATERRHVEEAWEAITEVARRLT